MDVERKFEVKCPLDDVFELLADVPKSVSHFPNVDELVDLGDGVYRWEMKPVGVDRFSVQTIYASKYTSNRDKGWVKWTPVKGEGNGLVKGQWTLKAGKEGTTRIKLTTHGELEVPLPRLVKLLVAPLVVVEFQRMIDTYIENLSKTFEGKKKRRPKKKKA